MNLAIIKTGGKQYVVSENKLIKVETILGDVGASVSFDEVLMRGSADGSTCEIGTPLIAGSKVSATIVKQGRARKVTGIKYKNKTRYRRTFGHRQPFTQVKIGKI